MVKLGGEYLNLTGDNSKDIISIRDDIYKLKDDLQYYLSHIDGGNMTSSFAKEMTDGFGNYSLIRQEADRISARVSDLDGNVANLAITAAGIESRVETAEGNISAVDLKADSISARVKDAEENISAVDLKADSISARVEDVKGDFSEFKEDVDGWEFKIKNGSQTRSATIKNGEIDLRDFDLTAKNVSSVTNLRKTEIVDGNMTLYSRDTTGDDYYEAGHIHYDQLGRLSIGSSSGVVLKLRSDSDMSIDAAANKTVYIGNSSTKNNVIIGNSDATNRRRVDLYGDVHINGNNVYIGRNGGTSRIDLYGDVYINGVKV